MSEHQAEAMQRIRKAHGDQIPKSVLQFHPTYSREVEAVVCRDCGAQLRGLVDDDRFDEMKEIGGQKVLIRRQIFMTLPMYAEALITFDDGSQHSTIGCRDCLSKLTPADLERHYTADLLDWSRQEQAGGGTVDWLHVAYRKPLSIKVLPQ